jgi:hypothetical protein
MKVVICLAHNYRAFDKPFAMSLWKIQRDFYKKNLGELLIVYAEGLQLDEMREQVVRKGMTHDPDYVLLLDTDMDFPEDCIERMVKHLIKTDYDAVCGLYCFRQPPFLPMLFKGWGDNGCDFVEEIPDEPFEIDCAGLGIIMIRGSFIKECKGRLFKKTESLGEEMYFFKEHRPKTLCDPSIDCGHWNLEKVDYARFKKENNIKDNKVPNELAIIFSDRLKLNK